MVTYKITSRDIPLTESMYAAVEEKIQSLERFFDRVLRFEVVLSRPHLHHRKNRFHHVRIHLKTRNQDIIIDREPEKNERHTSFRLAIQDAFHTLERRLEGEVKRMRDLVRHRRSNPQKISGDTVETTEDSEF